MFFRVIKTPIYKTNIDLFKPMILTELNDYSLKIIHTFLLQVKSPSVLNNY